MLHLDAAETYGGQWGAMAEAEDGEEASGGWRLPGDTVLGDPASPPPSSDPSEMALLARGAPQHDAVYAGASTLVLPDDPARLGGPGGCSDSPSSVGARRRYVLDAAAPKLTRGSDSLIDGLINSGASKYVEFKAVEGTWMWWEGAMCAVPASRAEVFRDRSMPPGDKRALMRFLKRVLAKAEAEGAAVGSRDPDDAHRAVGAPGSEWTDGRRAARPPGVDPTEADAAESSDAADPLCPDPTEAFPVSLARHGLSPRLIAAVAYALALRDGESAEAGPGLEALARYLASIGRFGQSVGALLTPVYGNAEFPQAFCRVAAVAGATYVLRLPVRGVLFGEGEGEAQGVEGVDGGLDGRRVTAVVTAGGQRLRCRALAIAADAWPRAAETDSPPAATNRRWVSRGVWITDGPLLPSGVNQGLVVFPPGQAPGAPPSAAVRVLQVGHSCSVAPPGRHVLYASVAAPEGAEAGGSGAAEADLRGVLEMLVDVGAARTPTVESDSDVDAARTPTVESNSDVDAAGTPSVESDSGTAAAAETVVDVGISGDEEVAGERGGARSASAPKPGVFPGVSKPRLLWGMFYRQAVPSGAPGVDAWRDVPANVVTCPGPDASCDFDHAMAAAGAGHRRLWGADAGELFAETASEEGDEEDGDGGGGGAGAARGGSEEEDELDVLLRDIPGQPSTTDAAK